MSGTITQNGVNSITTLERVTGSTEVTVNMPAVTSGASAAIGYIDGDGSFVAYLDGALVAGESKRFSCGTGVELVASITGYTADFHIEVGE